MRLLMSRRTDIVSTVGTASVSRPTAILIVIGVPALFLGFLHSFIGSVQKLQRRFHERRENNRMERSRITGLVSFHHARGSVVAVSVQDKEPTSGKNLHQEIHWKKARHHRTNRSWGGASR